MEQFGNKDMPMDPEYYPKLDESPLLDDTKISIYRSLIEVLIGF